MIDSAEILGAILSVLDPFELHYDSVELDVNRHESRIEIRWSVNR